MKIEFTNEQFRELLYDIALAAFIRTSICEEDDEELFSRIVGLERYLIGFADKFDAKDMVEEDEDGDQFVSEETMNDIIGETVEEFMESHFWEGLIMRLAHRDLLKTVPVQNLQKLIEKSETPPKEFQDLIERYAKEFQDHGIERLEIRR